MSAMSLEFAELFSSGSAKLLELIVFHTPDRTTRNNSAVECIPRLLLMNE